VTPSAPVSVMSPAAVTTSAPPTVPCPRFTPPPRLVAVSAPVLNEPSVIAPLPAATLAVFETVRMPAVWLIGVFVLASCSVLPVTLPASVMPLLPVSDTAPPLSAPFVVNEPPLDASVSAPVPALIALLGSVSVPAAVRLTAPLPLSVTPAISRLFLSNIDTPAPVAVTAPVKSLPLLFSASAPLALKVDIPVTVKAPPCPMPPPVVVTDRPPPPMFSAFALNVLLLVVRPDSAPLTPPTEPPNDTRPLAALTVSTSGVPLVALSTAPVKPTPALSEVSATLLPSVTAPV